MEEFRIKMGMLLASLVIFLIGYLYARLRKTSYYFQYGKEYLFCGTTYSGQIILARVIGKNKLGREHVCHSMDIDTSKLKRGHVYKFEFHDQPQAGTMWVSFSESFNSVLF